MSTEGTKTVKGRISNKHGTEEYWILSVYKSLDDLSESNKRDNPFMPLPGELIIYDPDSINKTYRYKFGDPENRDGGRRNIVDLPFVDEETIQRLSLLEGCISYLVGEITEGLAYTLSTDETYYNCSGMGTSTATEIIIAPVYNGLPVKGISANAFNARLAANSAAKELTSVIVPEGIEVIGDDAFRECKKLVSVSLPNTLTTIGIRAFYSCETLVDVEIPNSVTTLSQSAFNLCKALTSITIGNSLNTIGNSAFQDCAKLEYIYYNAENMLDLADNNYIFTGAGSEVANGIKLIIGKSVARIPAYLMHPASSKLPNITEVTFESESNCTEIGRYTFHSCSALKTLELPASLKTIGNNAFNGCSGLTKIFFNAIAMNDLSGGEGTESNYIFTKAGIATEGGIEVIIGKDVIYIPGHLFHPASTNRPNITSITFEKGSKCEVIGESAFCGCQNITTIEIPQNIKTLRKNAFNGCSKIATILFNAIAMEDLDKDNTVFEDAGNYIPEDINSKHEVDMKIGQDVTRIPTHIFHPSSDKTKCPNIAHIRFEENSLCTSIEEHAFSDCPTLLDIGLPHGLKTIGRNAFASCTGLTRISIPDSVNTIVDYAFYNCTSLEYIDIPDSVLTIGRSALRDCHKLKHVRLPNKLTILQKSMFEKTSDRYSDVTESIQSVIIPKSVTTIEQEVFLNALQLRDIYYTGTQAEWNNINIDTTVDEPGNDIDYLPMATIHYNFADEFVAVNEKIDNISVSSGGLPTDGMVNDAFLRVIDGKPAWDPIQYAEGNRF